MRNSITAIDARKKNQPNQKPSLLDTSGNWSNVDFCIGLKRAVQHLLHYIKVIMLLGNNCFLFLVPRSVLKSNHQKTLMTKPKSDVGRLRRYVVFHQRPTIAARKRNDRRFLVSSTLRPSRLRKVALVIITLIGTRGKMLRRQHRPILIKNRAQIVRSSTANCNCWKPNWVS